MADTLVRRVLGPGEDAPSVPLMINVVVPDSVLLGDDDGFGWVEHYGPVPGDLLREWIAANAEQGVDQWVRRLYASPKTGELVSMDSKSRRFEGALADYLRLRDQSAAPSGATPRSATSTTPRPMPTAVRPAQPTGRGCANTATTPRMPSAGQPGRGPDPATPSRP